MKDRITLHNMSFYAYHGVTRAEKEVGQRFYVDADIFLDLSVASASDRVKDTVDYEEVYNLITEIMLKRKYNLIEALAEDVAQAILQARNVQAVEVTVRKPQVPLGGILDYVSVTISRKKAAE